MPQAEMPVVIMPSAAHGPPVRRTPEGHLQRTLVGTPRPGAEQAAAPVPGLVVHWHNRVQRSHQTHAGAVGDKGGGLCHEGAGPRVKVTKVRL